MCAEAGRGLIVLAAGFGDVDVAGETAERELVSIAHRHGMRLLGPASMGVISTVPEVSMHATFAPVSLRPGRVAFSSQSGPLGVALLEQAHRAGVGISHFVALGNKADVSTNDFLQFWEGDDATAVIALHIASFGNPRKFTRLARRVSRTKPIVAVKTGGDADRTVDALFRQTGVIPVSQLAELFDVARVLESQPLPAGARVAVLSNAHGALSLAQAALAQSRLELAEIGGDARAHLASALPTGASVTNPIDLTFGAEPSDYDVALRTVLADDGVDSALVIFASPLPSRVEDIASVIVAAHVSHAEKPVLASVLGLGDRALHGATSSTVPAFAFPETAVATLAARHAARTVEAPPRRRRARSRRTRHRPRPGGRAGAARAGCAAVGHAAAMVGRGRPARQLRDRGGAGRRRHLCRRCWRRGGCAGVPGGAQGDGHDASRSVGGGRRRARPARRRRGAGRIRPDAAVARRGHGRSPRSKDDRARSRNRGGHPPRPDVRPRRHVRPRRCVCPRHRGQRDPCDSADRL